MKLIRRVLEFIVPAFRRAKIARELRVAQDREEERARQNEVVSRLVKELEARFNPPGSAYDRRKKRRALLRTGKAIH